MKKILGLTVAALLVMGLVGGGTWAYFTDVETSTGNTFAAGTLDLSGGDAVILTTDVGNVAPGDSGSDTCALSNVGSLAGELDIALSAITNTESTGSTEYEADDPPGELGGEAKMVLWLDADEDTTFNVGDIELNTTAANAYHDTNNNSLDMATIDSYGSVSWDAAFATLDELNGTNDEVTFTIDWEVPTTTGNTIQGDSVSFNITFTLEQPAAP